MSLRRQILLATMSAGAAFTLMLCWMIYFTQPIAVIMPSTSGLTAAIATILLFWWVMASMAERAIQSRIQKSVTAVRTRLEESFAMRRRMEKQQIMVEQFAQGALPATHALAEQADGIAKHSLELAKNTQPATITSQLRATTRELSDEILRLGDHAQTVAAEADLLHHDLNALAAQNPQLAEQLQQLSQLAKKFNLLALNAAIETARSFDPNRGVGLLTREMKQLSNNAEQMMHTLQEQIAQLSDSLTQNAEASGPLAQHMRILAGDTETLTLFTDEQWSEIDSLQQDDGMNDHRYRLIDHAQALAEQSTLLKSSLEGLVKNLQLTN